MPDTYTHNVSEVPTEEGCRRFPKIGSGPAGYYEEIPCTCTPECKDVCLKCDACSAAYYDAIEYD